MTAKTTEDLNGKWYYEINYPQMFMIQSGSFNTPDEAATALLAHINERDRRDEVIMSIALTIEVKSITPRLMGKSGELK